MNHLVYPDSDDHIRNVEDKPVAAGRGEKGVLVRDTDLSTQFQAICQKAEVAREKIQDASRKQPRTAAPSTHAEASDAGTHQVSADIVQDEPSEPWQDIRDRWRSHVARRKKDIKTTRAELDAADAVKNAGMAESYAREAIEFALDAVDEAEEAVLDALHARATANALVS